MAQTATDSKTFERGEDGTIRVSTGDMRNSIGEIVDLVVEGERCIVSRFGRDRLALISMKDYERFLAFEKAESKGRRRSS
jgi:prevent-host-death family protein